MQAIFERDLRSGRNGIHRRARHLVRQTQFLISIRSLRLSRQEPTRWITRYDVRVTQKRHPFGEFGLDRTLAGSVSASVD